MANRFRYEITADDKTEKGAKSAEKRIGGLTKATNRYGDAAKKADKNASGKKSGFAQVGGAADQTKRAAGRLAATVPGLSRYTSTLGEMHEAASKAATGLRNASQAGSGLSASLGGIAAVGGGVIGIVGALAAGAVKLASGWAEGGAQLGRLSQSLGISIDDLQKFQAVGEQFGVDKEATTGGLGGIASTLHEAKYGRNNEALAAMNQLGIAPKYDANGQPDITDFTKQLSDTIARQKDPMTQARIASMFGASGMLTMLRAGSGEVGSRMTAAGKYAAVMDDKGVSDATRLWNKGVLGKQLAGRAGMAVERDAALAAEPALDASLAAGRAAADGGGVKGAAAGVGSAAVNALGGAAKWAAGEVAQLGGVIEGLVNRHTLGGRLNNLGNVRPVGGKGFVHFDRPEDSLVAMGAQIVRDETVHGARNLQELYGGRIGPDGKPHWGYAPASDHNDSAGYAKEVGERSGVGAGALDPSDAKQLAAIMSASVRRETGTKITPDQMLPMAQAAIDKERRLVIEFHGAPAGLKMTARMKDGKAVAVGHTMAGAAPA